MTDVLASIDAAVEEWERRDDAARWSPDLLDDGPQTHSADDFLDLHAGHTYAGHAAPTWRMAPGYSLTVGGVDMSPYVSEVLNAVPAPAAGSIQFHATNAGQAWEPGGDEFYALRPLELTESQRAAVRRIYGQLVDAVVLPGRDPAKRERMRRLHTIYRARKRGWR